MWRRDAPQHRRTATNDKDQVYAYDDLNRLTGFDSGTLSGSSITGTHVNNQDWTLDQLGNWSDFEVRAGGSVTLDQQRVHNQVNEIDVDDNHGNSPGASITATTGSNWDDPKYDAAGNMTLGPIPGNETASNSYIYDAWNRLVRVVSGMTTVAEYEYDGLNRRIAKGVYVGGSLDHTDHYYYNKSWQMVEVRRDAGMGEDADPREQFVWHPYYVDALAVRYFDADTDDNLAEAQDGAHYYLHDANFNVTAVVNASGTVLERYEYTPYGAMTALDASFAPVMGGASTIDNSVAYTGREFNVETGLYQYRNRYYHPTLGRFISRDPIGYNARDVNLYRYVGGMPTSELDPLGLFTYACSCSCTTNHSYMGTAATSTSTEIVGVDAPSAAAARKECSRMCDSSRTITYTGGSTSTNCSGSVAPMPISGSEPTYDPDAWNDNWYPWPFDDGDRQWANNCTSYAYDNGSTACNPGGASPAPPITTHAEITCANAIAGAKADGLTAVSCDSPCPAGTSKVALVVDPGVDYHWYRQDDNGYWSHKPGNTPVTNVDNSGNSISDPRTCNRRGDDLHYTDFCSCFCAPR